jgi:pimeloyl-ACP methyl ester carboxylesterase
LAATVFTGSHGGVVAQDAQATKAKRSPRTQILIDGESFVLKGKAAFVMNPKASADADSVAKPWVFYAPTLAGYPDSHETWMHQQFLDAGIGVAGIDVGEAYGSPLAFEFFDALHDEMTNRGFARKPVLLGRSRGGLWVSSYAIHHPDRVAAIAGIYPVFDFTTYPGIDRAAGAYGLTPEALIASAARLNPIARAGELADAKIPVYIIHGNDDKVVPMDANSAALQKAYFQAGAGDLITLQRIDGQGHNFWEGFFHCQPLVDFVIEHAK